MTARPDRWSDPRVFGPPPAAYPSRPPIVIRTPGALPPATRRSVLIAGRNGAGKTPAGPFLVLARRLTRRPVTRAGSYSE